MPACRNHPDITEGIVHCVRCGAPGCGSCVVSLQGLPYCAACKVERLRDVQAGVAPLEGGLQLASILQRWLAVIVDYFVIAIPVGIVAAVLLLRPLLALLGSGEPSQEDMGRFMVLELILGVGLLAVSIVYEALMLQSKGQTLGKMLVGVKVTTAEGRALSPSQCWGRATVRCVVKAFPIVGYFVNYLPAFFTDEKTCLHDIAARTRVVVVR